MSDFVNPLTDYSPQMETTESYSEMEFGSRSGSGAFSQDDELELASEFLEVANEQQLDEFIGRLIEKAGQALNETVEPPLEQDLGDILRSVAKVALPIVGGALGTFVGGPAGGALGSSLASAAGHAFGLELEGLSPEDSEFEASKQFIKLAGATVENALEADPYADPANTAYRAAVEAARVHAPGLIKTGERSPYIHRKHRRSGRWVRHHGKIILLGV
jgi:malonyl CoA-acyl carrier protein transacylase